MRVFGEVEICLIEPATGEVISREVRRNLVTTVGLDFLASMLRRTYTTSTGYVAIGTDGTAAANSNTALGAESTRCTAYAHTYTTVAGTSCKVELQGWWIAADASIYVKEVGLFVYDASAVAGSGDLFARVVVDQDNSAPAGDVRVTWAFTFTRG